MYKETNTIPRILALWFEYYNRTYVLPEILANILLCQTSLINLSYIYSKDSTSWIYILTLVARPQLIINVKNLEYVGIVYLLLWLLYLFKQHIFGNKVIKLVNTLLKGALFNFVIEQIQDGILGLVISSLICLILIIDSAIMQGTLNIQTVNFQTTYPSKLYIIKNIFNIIIVFCNKFNYSANFIKIMAIICSCVQIISIFQYNNYRCKQIRVVILFIHLTTIYFGVINLLNNYEHSYTLILLPLFWRLAASLKLKPFGDEDPIIQGSISLKNGKLFDGFLTLTSLKEENIIRNIKLNFLIQECVEAINCKINSQSILTQNLKGVATTLIENDIKNAFLSNKINEIIEKKLSLLYNIKTATTSQINSYIKQVNEVKMKLDSYHQNQNSSAVQALAVFFYAEILNDYITAKSLQNQVVTTLETQLRNNDTALSKLIYLVANYENKKITLTSISSNAPKVFCTKDLDELIPSGIREWHDALIDRFFHDGYSKYVRNLQQNYIAYGKYIETVLFALDIVYTNQVDIICLLQPTAIDNKTIIINQNYEITSMSQDFSNFVSLSKYFCFGEKIDKFIPEIVNIHESCSVEDIVVIPAQHIVSVTNLDDQKTEMNYYCDINVTVQKIQGKMIYMIISFENFKKQITIKTEQIQQEGLHSLEILNSEIIPLEIEEDKITEPYQFSIYSKLSSSSEAVVVPNNLQRKSCLKVGREGPKKKVNIFSPREDDEEELVKFYRNSLKVNSQFKKTQFVEEVEDQFNENQSQVSSIKAFRNSKFYRKYELYNKFLNFVPHKSLHKTITGLIFSLFLYQIIFILIQLTGLSLMTFYDDINLLEIKNLIFQPIEVFLVTRWTLFNYKNSLAAQTMTQADYNAKSAFAKSNLQLGYDQLNSNIQSVLFLQDLQTLLQEQYIYAYQYLDTYKSESYNMTLRTAIQVLLNFQYTLKMNYVIDGTVNTDTPQIFYSYKNYGILNDVATELNNDIAVQTILREQKMQQEIINILIVQQLLVLFNLLIIIIAKFIINKRLKMCIHLYSFVEEEEILNEIAQQQELLKQLKNDNSYKFSYNLDIDLKEQKFLAKINDSVTAKQKRDLRYGVTIFGFIILLFFFYLLLSVNQLIIFLSQNNFLTKYPETTTYMRMFADLGVDIPRMFAQREILYGRSKIVYLNETDFTYDMKQIRLSLEQTIEFTSMEIDFSNILVTDSFQQYYSEISQNDLCEYIPEDIKNKSMTLCTTVFNQNMKLGLKSVLIFLQNIIATEIIINNFTHRNTTTSYELEGIFIFSQIIRSMNKFLFSDMITLTSGIVNYIKIINICFLSFLCVFVIFGIKIIHQKLIQSSRQIVHFAYLIPSQTLFSNDIFERVVRSLIIKN